MSRFGIRAALALAGAAALSIALLYGAVGGNETEAAGPSRIAYGFGSIPGQDLNVHVAVLVAPGQSERAAVNTALAAQGARPFSDADYSTNGLVHDAFANGGSGSAIQVSVNSANDPGVSLASALDYAFLQWTGVEPATLVIAQGATTSACPSLLKECPGRQTFNGVNEAIFYDIKGRNTIAVTWYGTSLDEFDMAYNLRFAWNVGGGPDVIDVNTVALHEVGHGLGLGHSDVSGAVMEAIYDGYRPLHHDDEAGLNALYSSEPTPTVTPTATATPEPTATPEAGAVEIDDGDLSSGSPYGKGDTVRFSVHVATSGGGDAAGVSVQVRITTTSGRILAGTGTTGSSGDANFSYKVNPKRDGVGFYAVDATAGDVSDLTPGSFKVK